MTDELLEINRTLGNIEGRLDALQDRFDAHTTRHDKLHTHLEEEVDSIQADVNKAKGASTVIGVVAGTLGATLVLIGKHLWGES